MLKKHGLVSNHNLFTRWARHSFDSVSCFGTCHNLGEVLENYVTSEQRMCLPLFSRPEASVPFHAAFSRFVSSVWVLRL